MKRSFFTICSFLLFTCIIIGVSDLRAQAPERITVRGKVTDSKDKLPVIGASVIEVDKDGRTITGVSTDINGNFALRVSNPTHQIAVSFIGYKTFRQGINSRTVINVALVGSSNELSDVVITSKRPVTNGTGLNIDEKNSTMASTTINAKDLEELSAQSIDQALQGRMPGVDFGASSGDPGAGMSIRIRGTSSINGSAQPMIVLDGMPYETEIPSDFNFGSADEQGYAQLLNIAPTDIRTITVLKDAASTAMWGARAANGVLVIETKRGMIGKPSIAYNFRGTSSKQPEAIPLLSGNQYSTLIFEAFNNRSNDLPLNPAANPEFLYDPMMPAYFSNYSQNSDWISSITQTGLTQDHNISLQGGGEKARYYGSVGYLNSRGTTVGTDLTRMTTKINLDYNVSQRIRFRSDFTYTHVDNTLNYSGSVRGVAYKKMPNMAIYQYDEYGNQTPNYFSPISNIQGSYGGLNNRGDIVGTVNPLAMAKEASSRLFGERITPKFNLQYDVLPSVLLTTFDLQFDINNIKTKTFLPQIASGRPSTETLVNRAVDNDGDSFNVNTKLNFLFTPKLGANQTLQSLLSFQTTDARNVGQNITIANTASSLLQDPSNPGRTQNSDLVLTAPISQYRNIGVVLSNQYSAFEDRYIVNVGLRLDGNSRFGSNNRYGLFPSVSTRWRISDELFLRDVKFIDDFSLRLSYGASGREPSKDYLFYNTYVPSESYMGLPGVLPGAMGLDNLKWQTNIGRNLGFNFAAFQNRLRVDVDLYNNKIKDLLLENLQIPGSTGYSTVRWSNVGVMVNKGFEIGINTIPLKKKDWQVTFDFNLAQNINVIKEISEFYPKTDGSLLNANGQYRSYLQVGNPYGSFYGFKYKGVYSTKDDAIARDAAGNQIIGPNGQVKYMVFNYPSIGYEFEAGDAMYEDINKDGNINEDDVVYLGNSTPKLIGGFGSSVSYKDLRIQAFFSYKLGYELINETLMTTTNMYGFDNQSTIVLRRWRNPGDVTDVPRALYRSGYNSLGSDRYVSDASFVRLRSLTARYSLSRAILNRLNVKNASVFVTAENLYTWTNYMGVDPDISARGDNNPFKYPTDDAMTPPSKNILLGLTIGF